MHLHYVYMYIPFLIYVVRYNKEHQAQGKCKYSRYGGYTRPQDGVDEQTTDCGKLLCCLYVLYYGSIYTGKVCSITMWYARVT